MTEYRVVFEPAEDGSWSGYSIDLPGVFTTGDDRREVEENMKEALALHLDELGRTGVGPPAPCAQTAVISL